MSYDLIVIGSGPGGYEAAIRAAQLGLKTACIDKRERFGGTCLNVGCIPSKTLLHTTELYANMQTKGAIQGFDASSLRIDFAKMMQHKEQVVVSLTDGVAGLFKKYGVEGIHGEAVVKAEHKVEVGGKTYETKAVLLATGSEPIALPFLPIDEKMVLSSTGALELPEIPKSLLVVGAGVIGLEIASVYARLGTKVIIVEMLDRVGGNLDPNLNQQYQQILKKQQLDIRLSTMVISAKAGRNEISLTVEKDQKQEVFTAEKVLLAIGRKPFSKGLPVELNEKGFVKVNEHFQTSVPSIYAIGDLIEGPMLAHRASEEGVVLAEYLAGHPSSVDYLTIPSIIYTHPEVATVGFTETEAKSMNLETFSGTCYFKANARARCQADTEGLIKVVGEKSSGRLLGVQMIGPQVSELIGETVVAMKGKFTIEELAHTSHAHPTLSETIKEACLIALGRPINV